MDLADRIQLWISYAIRISLLIAIAVASITQQWLSVFLTILILFLTFLPGMITHNYKVYLPIEFELTIIFFVYATLYLGEIREFYTRFWWWDGFLHGISGVVLGFIGFFIVYILNHEKKIKLNMGPKFVALFSFTFAVAIGAVWEILEFAIDNIFGLNMQTSGLIDTMWDLIIDAMGAIIAALCGYFYVRGGDSLVFDRLLRKFMQKNPELFGEKE